MWVDPARQYQQAAGVDLLGVRIASDQTGPHFRNRGTENADVDLLTAVGQDGLPAANEHLGILSGGDDTAGARPKAPTNTR